MNGSRLALHAKRFIYYLTGRFLRPRLDVVFVTPPKSASGWILDGICREISSRLPAGVTYATVCADEPLPFADRYFFSHYMYFFSQLSKPSASNYRGNFVFFTHLESLKHNINDARVFDLLGMSDGVICMNSGARDELSDHGFETRRITVAVGGADENFFQPNQRLMAGAIGFVSAYYERKNPDLMLETIQKLPHRRFILLGKNWEKYGRFDELKACTNLDYINAPYAQYPEIYRKMSVFVSTSTLEGGPIPLIEAMMSNVVPVVSMTGFAKDVVQHGVNGYLFDPKAKAAEVVQLINQAYGLDADVRACALPFTWTAFAAKVQTAMGIDKVVTSN